MRFELDLYDGKTNEKKRGDFADGTLTDARAKAIRMLKLYAPKDYRAWVKIWVYGKYPKKPSSYKGDVGRHHTKNGRVFVWYVAGPITIYKLNTNGTTSTKYL